MPPVEKGERTKLIYQTWEECKEQIQGYKNSIFKAFQRKKKRKISYRKTTTIGPLLIQTLEKVPLYSEIKSEFIAYVDGSYHNGAYSYGCVIFDGKEMKRIFKIVSKWKRC